MDKIEKRRIYIIYIFFALLFLLILGKALSIQVINRKGLLTYANDQTLRTSTVYPYRGHIYDRFNSPLAINIQTYTLFVFPKHIKNKEKLFKDLAKIIPTLNMSEIRKKMSSRIKYTFLARKIPLNEAQLEALKKIEGIYTESVPKRVYPNNETLAQVIGFVGIDNSGLSGMEYLYNKELRGQPRISKYYRDAKGRPIKIEGVQVEGRAENLYLSIDKDLQGAVESYLKEAVVHHQADSGGVGVMDVQTGELLAIANYPTFNPNTNETPSKDSRRATFATDPFEPGSIFKVLVIASALEHKVATPVTKYYCEKGSFRVQNHTIREAEAHEVFEWLSLSDILKFSSNVGTTKVAFDVTYPKFRQTLLDFGIGSKTGIEVPLESRGIFTDKEKISPLSLSNISFGQGVATTAIQMLKVYAIIANDGCDVKPTLLRRDDIPQKLDENGCKEGVRRIVSKETAQALKNMLANVVTDGTGGGAQIPYFKMAGKTGTAQRVRPQGGYQGYIGSFIGFPLNIKKPFIVFAYVNNPKKNGYYGNVVASPIVKKVAQYMLYREKETLDYSVELANDKQKDNLLQKHNEPSPLSELPQKRTVTVGITPNFIGLDKKSAEELAQAAGLSLTFMGYGIVTEQTPVPGAPYETVGPVTLKCQLPSYE